MRVTGKLIGLALGSLLAFIGSFLPWLTAGPFYSAGGMSGQTGVVGVWTLMAALLLLAAALLEGRIPAWVAPCAAGGIFLTGISSMVPVWATTGAEGMSPGAGVWLVTIGGLFAVLACAVKALDAPLSSLAPAPAPRAMPVPGSYPAQAPYPAAAPAPGAPFRPAPGAPFRPAPGPAAPPAATGGWHATHRTPVDGLPARERPDPNLPVILRIAQGVNLSVVQWHGDWALVQTDQGWTAWVDGRRLEPLNPTAP